MNDWYQTSIWFVRRVPYSDIWQNCTHVSLSFYHLISPITVDLPATAEFIKTWGRKLGFQQVVIAGLDLRKYEQHLEHWLAAGYHGDMEHMCTHDNKRPHPEGLVPGTLRVVSLRMNYLPGDTFMAQLLAKPEKAYVSHYALGRDYQKPSRLTEFRRTSTRSAFAPLSTVPRYWQKPLRKKRPGLNRRNTLVLNHKAGN